jgi:hypothetical protein
MSIRRDTILRVQEALTLTVSALAVSIACIVPFGMLSEQLAAVLAAGLPPQVADVTALPLLLVCAGVATGWHVRRRRRAATPEAVPDGAEDSPVTPTASSAAKVEEGSAITILGLSVTMAFIGEPLATFGALFGPGLASRHPMASGIGGMSVIALGAWWLYRCARWRASAERRSETSAAGIDLSRMHGLFRWYVHLLGTAIVLGFAILVARWSALIWFGYLPWTALISAIACLVALIDTAVVAGKTRASLRSTLKDAATRQLWAQLILGLLALFALGIFQGLRESAELFARVSPSVRLAFLAMPALFLAFVVATMLRFALAGHWVRVFISYQHDRDQAATDLEAVLRRFGLLASRIPFRDDHAHDRLLHTIQDEIRRCDAMLCLPGARASFVENEVLVASTLRKFIVFLVGKDEPRLPNTAYYGYPVFRLERVARRGYRPVCDLVSLVAGNWRASLRFFVDSWSRPFDDNRTLGWLVLAFVGGSYAIGAVHAALTAGARELWPFVSGFHRAYLDLLGSGLFPWLFLNAFVIGCAFAMVNILRVRRVLRQEILTGHLTREHLRKHLGNGKRASMLLACLWKRPPPAEHEVERLGRPR